MTCEKRLSPLSHKTNNPERSLADAQATAHLKFSAVSDLEAGLHSSSPGLEAPSRAKRHMSGVVLGAALVVLVIRALLTKAAPSAVHGLNPALHSPAYQASRLEAFGSAGSVSGEQLLGRVHITITFFWDIHKLGWLQQVVGEVLRYPTDKKVVIICNQGSRLLQHMVSGSWRVSNNLTVYHTAEHFEDTYELGWVHRRVINATIAEDDTWTAFMHLSDDMLVEWEALMAWADDTVLLKPLGFQRGFTRTEVMPWNGRASLMDQVEGPVNLTTYKRTVHVDRRGGRSDAVRGQLHYIQLPVSFQGMWAASRAQLEQFMASPFWELGSAMQMDTGWGLPEMSECSVLFVGAPEGFFTAAVVPYNPATKQLLQVGFVQHLPNKWCGYMLPDYADKPAVAGNSTTQCVWDTTAFLV